MPLLASLAGVHFAPHQGIDERINLSTSIAPAQVDINAAQVQAWRHIMGMPGAIFGRGQPHQIAIEIL